MTIRRTTTVDDESKLVQGIALRLGIPIVAVLDSEETSVREGHLVSAQLLCTSQRQFNAIFGKLLQHRCQVRYVQFIRQTDHLQVTYVEKPCAKDQK